MQITSLFFFFTLLIYISFTCRSKKIKFMFLCRQSARFIIDNTHLSTSGAFFLRRGIKSKCHTRLYTQTHNQSVSARPVVKSIKKTRSVGVREHKQNSAKLLFAFHIPLLHCSAAALALCTLNTMLFTQSFAVLYADVAPEWTKI